MERHIIPIQSRPVATSSEHTPVADPLAVLQSYSDSDTSIDDRRDNSERILLLQVAKGIAIPQKTEVPVSVSTSSA